MRVSLANLGTLGRCELLPPPRMAKGCGCLAGNATMSGRRCAVRRKRLLMLAGSTPAPATMITIKTKNKKMETRLSKYTPTQEKRRKRDTRLYQEYVSWASTNAAPGNIVRYLMRKYSFKSRASVYYAVERGKKIFAEMQNNENE